MYAGRTRKVKTDRRGARALAEACLLGAYRPAYRLSDPQRHVRGCLLVRDALVRTRYISFIRALLRQHGYRVPSGEVCHGNADQDDSLAAQVARRDRADRPPPRFSATRVPRGGAPVQLLSRFTRARHG